MMLQCEYKKIHQHMGIGKVLLYQRKIKSNFGYHLGLHMALLSYQILQILSINALIFMTLQMRIIMWNDPDLKIDWPILNPCYLIKTQRLLIYKISKMKILVLEVMVN